MMGSKWLAAYPVRRDYRLLHWHGSHLPHNAARGRQAEHAISPGSWQIGASSGRNQGPLGPLGWQDEWRESRNTLGLIIK